MKLLAYFMASMLLVLASTAPTSNEDKRIYITEDFFEDNLVIHNADHDIVNLLLPLNRLNFEDDDVDEVGSNNVLFFVLADKDNGNRIDQGLYVRKEEVVTKLLDNGRDAAVGDKDTDIVYFAAKDGIYFYNSDKNKADKYGNITDSIISIAKVNGDDIIYILTDNYILYKVTQGGTKKEKIEEVVNAQKIVVDNDNNLYYYTADKHVYILGPDGAKKVTELAEEPSYIDILKAPLVMDEGIPVIMDDKLYVVSSNGTAQMSAFEFKLRPTAYSMETAFTHFFAYNKTIYEYNVLSLLLSDLPDDGTDVLDNDSDDSLEIDGWLEK